MNAMAQDSPPGGWARRGFARGFKSDALVLVGEFDHVVGVSVLLAR